jgi:hypothetical protein
LENYINIEQIKSIIAGAEEFLRLLHQQPEYQRIERKISTPNDLVLADAVQTLSEIYQAIVESEYYFPDSNPEQAPDQAQENPSNLFDLLGT